YSNYGGLSLRATRGWYDVELEGELPEYDKSQAHGALMGKRWFGKWLYLRAGGEAIHDKGYGVLGVGYVLPLLIEAELNVNHDGERALGLEHEAVLTKHLRFAAKGHWTRDDTDWAA